MSRHPPSSNCTDPLLPSPPLFRSLTRDIRMRPGQAVRLGGVIIRLRACEATPAWEKPPLTGAFLQVDTADPKGRFHRIFRSEEHTSELQSLMRISYAVF